MNNNIKSNHNGNQEDELQDKIKILEMKVYKEQQEKDFFFQKLSNMDSFLSMILQQDPENMVALQIQKILMTTESERVSINIDLTIDLYR